MRAGGNGTACPAGGVAGCVVACPLEVAPSIVLLLDRVRSAIFGTAPAKGR
jgi:hypothetical protein